MTSEKSVLKFVEAITRLPKPRPRPRRRGERHSKLKEHLQRLFIANSPIRDGKSFAAAILTKRSR